MPRKMSGMVGEVGLGTRLGGRGGFGEGNTE